MRAGAEGIVAADRGAVTREASCQCGQLRVRVEGEPVRISMCHCLACQRRTGSPFGAQARFPEERVEVDGEYTEHRRVSDDGGEERIFRFCPRCGSTVFYSGSELPELIAVPVGAFADPGFPPPRTSVWERRRHPWVVVPESVERRRD